MKRVRQKSLNSVMMDLVRMSNRDNQNSINLGHIIETLLKDYDIHLLPEADGVNVTIELHVQVC
ncbi:unnamed protein product [Anisakis simplex]|uniref:Rho-GAP domain-containing protein n=1 Tax=Anisakis simplex TaxID=6269 RepID=A0A0M3J0Z6_ANISI|nr:unnamed protein product [Anisakis simplex]